MITVVKAAPHHASAMHIIEVLSFPDPWSVSSLEHEIANTSALCLVALEHDLVLGHISMRHIIDEGHINNIAVAQAHRQKGVGSLLLEALIQGAEALHITGLTLEARANNAPALNLYKKYGFAIAGHRKNFYTQPTEDAVIMWKIMR